jgi:hypothetical protein
VNLLKLFSGATGLNTRVDPVRLMYDPETGIQDLAAAVNVDIDDSGRVSRVKGYTRVATGSYHSLFCDKDMALVVTGDALCILKSDYTLKPLRNVTAGARMSYAQVDDVIYYANGIEMGKVQNELSWAWEYAGERVGPETDREFQSPPLGNMVSHYNGRMYVIQRNNIWYSEPYDHSAFDMTRNLLPFESEVKMFLPMEKGVYVSDSNNVYFLEGDAFKERFFEKIPKLNYPAVPGTEDYVTGMLDLSDRSSPSMIAGVGQEYAVFVTTRGICVGSPEGDVFNMTEARVDLPVGSSGCGIVLNNRYISMINP